MCGRERERERERDITIRAEKERLAHLSKGRKTALTLGRRDEKIQASQLEIKPGASGIVLKKCYFSNSHFCWSRMVQCSHQKFEFMGRA